MEKVNETIIGRRIIHAGGSEYKIKKVIIGGFIITDNAGNEIEVKEKELVDYEFAELRSDHFLFLSGYESKVEVLEEFSSFSKRVLSSSPYITRAVDSELYQIDSRYDLERLKEEIDKTMHFLEGFRREVSICAEELILCDECENYIKSADPEESQCSLKNLKIVATAALFTGRCKHFKKMEEV